LEKFSSRLASGKALKENRRMAYCLSQLKLTSKSVRRLIELAPRYKGTLYDDEVYSHFGPLKHGAKQIAKAKVELKTEVEVWEALLQSSHESGSKDATAARRASEASALAASKKSRKAKASRRKNRGDSDEG
jgi:hypothetical protein